MIQLTSVDGAQVCVNPFHVFYIRPLAEGSQIVSSDGTAIEVREPFEQLVTNVKAWVRG